MKTITEYGEGAKVRVAALTGESRFVNRDVSIGLTPGCRVEIVKNRKNRPLLVYSRDTMIRYRGFPKTMLIYGGREMFNS